MNKLRYIFLFFTIINSLILVAQSYTYKQKRDWVVGEYQGLRKDSTANGPWFPYTSYVRYHQNYDPNDDSLVVNSFEGNNNVYKISDDSLFLQYWGQYSPYDGGKLFADSTLHFNFVAWGSPFEGGHMIWFKGKLVQSYVGVKEELQQSLKINLFPNPSPDYIHVRISNYQKIKQLSWDITNIEGKQMLDGVFISQTLTINTKELPNGAYFLNIRSKEGVIYKKFIIQH